MSRPFVSKVFPLLIPKVKDVEVYQKFECIEKWKVWTNKSLIKYFLKELLDALNFNKHKMH